jgi:hypothetical protein
MRTLITSTCGYCGHGIYWEAVYHVWRHLPRNNGEGIGPVRCDRGPVVPSGYAGNRAIPTTCRHLDGSVTKSRLGKVNL